MASSGYSGTPLVKKLGIKPDSVLALLDAPAGFRTQLVDLPAGVRIVTGDPRGADIVMYFAHAARDLSMRVAAVRLADGAGLWIAWPKKASGVKTDVTEHLVRGAGLANGLVDYKVCAI